MDSTSKSDGPTFPVSPRIGVVGLGYVGLPLAVSFAQKFDVVGYDIDAERIQELQTGTDRTLEVTSEQLRTSRINFSSSSSSLDNIDVYIITTPTPIDQYKNPDLTALLSASAAVGDHLSPGGVVIFESTVYPGATEEACVPVLEGRSGLRLNEGFFVGYSPERINPGDREHRFETIVKVVSGSTPECTDFVAELYGQVVTAGTHRAPSIKVAEAAKVIENTQRDVNIALINELSLIFDRLGIDTHHVLEAAGTKWNFLPFTPGLVGGHCIGVDPYYLTHKAKEVGLHPEVILAGRRINDAMGHFIAQRLITTMLARKVNLGGSKLLIIGLTFKENTPDLRNTRIVDTYQDLISAALDVEVYDPWADAVEAKQRYDIDLIAEPTPAAYAGIIFAVPHKALLERGSDWIASLRNPSGSVVFDLKSVLPKTSSDIRL